MVNQSMGPHPLYAHYVGDVNSFHNVSDEAFVEGLKFFEAHLSKDYVRERWLGGKASMNDVYQVARDAEEQYASAKGGDRKHDSWPARLPEQILHYSSVIDIFMQSHPEYAALAWGAIKFVLMGFAEHANIFEKVAESLTKIGQTLERVKAYSELYPPSLIIPALGPLYGYVIAFLKKAVKWYTMSPWKRAWKAVTEPFDVGYQHTVHRIEMHTRYLEGMAAVAEKVEIRGITQYLQSLLAKFAEFSARQVTMEGKVDDLVQTSAGAYSLSQRISADVLDLRIAGVMQELGYNSDAIDHLNQCRVATKKPKTWLSAGHESQIILNSVQRWASSSESALLVVQGPQTAEPKLKDLAVSMIDFCNAAKARVVWSLSPKQRPPTLDSTHMWKSLILQVLQYNNEALHSGGLDLSIAQMKTHHEEREWLSLFSKIVSELPKFVVVIEAKDLFAGAGYDAEWVSKFVAIFQCAVDEAARHGRVLKVLVTSYCSERSAVATADGANRRITAFVTPPGALTKKKLKKGRAAQMKAGRAVRFS